MVDGPNDEVESIMIHALDGWVHGHCKTKDETKKEGNYGRATWRIPTADELVRRWTEKGD